MASNDGKYLEEAVEKYLKTIKRTEFHWRRLYDAHSARNYMPAQPADFFISDSRGYRIGSNSCHLECKTSKHKKMRLTKFSQHSALNRWNLAGVPGYVLVHFYVPDKMFLVPSWELDIGKPSWVIGPQYEIEDVSKILEVIYDSKV